MIKALLFICAFLFSSLTVSAVYQKTQKSDIYYYQAKRLMEQGDFEKANLLFSESLSVRPRRLDAMKGLAYSYRRLKNYPQAIKAFQSVLSLAPRDHKIKSALAQTYVWNKDYAEAIRLYSEVVVETKDPQAKLSLAEVFMWDQKYAPAEGLARQILQDDPGDLRARILLAQTLQYSQRYKEAMQVYRGLFSRSDISPQERENLQLLFGEAAMVLKDYGTSLAVYREALDKNPRNVELRAREAEILSWQGHYSEAIAEYERAIKEAPFNLSLKKKLAQVYVWKKDYRSAENIYKEVIASDPKDFEAYAGIWDVMIMDKRYTAALIYFDAVLSRKKDRDMLLFYVKKLVLVRDYRHAAAILHNMLSWEPENRELKEYLADLLSYNKEFAGAERLYEELLRQGYDRRIKKKLADVYSWDKQYARSVRLYDELLAEKENEQVWLQKARVLGWAKDHVGAIREYRELFRKTGDPLVKLEMEGKDAYWKGHWDKATECYARLIQQSSDNVEVRFDLAQIYSYRSLWKEAIGEYEGIMKTAPGHFQAREGLQKARLISTRLSVRPGYEFYRARSTSRMDDIKRNTFFTDFTYPLGHALTFGLDYRLTKRSFNDFSDLTENEARFGLSYKDNPDWWAGAYYGLTAYNRDIDTLHTFGASHGFRFLDSGVSMLSFDRRRLENNSTVIRGRFYSDDLKERVVIDLNERLKAGAEYLFSNYSDGNNLQQPAADLLYYISLDPRRLSLRYRYWYENFLHKVNEYFSPKKFSTQALKIDWRQYLNKEEIFFGADDLYYGLSYEATVDSTNIVSHIFCGEFNWDINKRLNLNVKASDTESSSSVYRDRNIMASLKYYF